MSMIPNEEPTPAIKLFQSAHGKLVTLQRINDQLSSVLVQRQRVQDELKAIRAQIDDLFERELRQEPPSARSPAENSGGDMAFRLGAIETAPEAASARRALLEKLGT